MSLSLLWPCCLFPGCLQEEIFFSICPELLLSRPLSQHLRSGEAAHCWGCLRFSSFTGYARSFRCCLNAQGDKGGAPLRAPRGAQQVEETQDGEAAPRQHKADGAGGSETVSKQQQGKETHQAPEKRGPAGKSQLLLYLGSDDEETEAPGGPARGPRQGSWQGWDGVEGVEALDRTPLRVQWLGLLRRDSPGAPSGAPVREEREGDKQTDVASRAPPPWCSPVLRVETASIVAALDARRFGSPGAAGRKAAAAEAMGVVGSPHSSSAAAREVLHPSYQFRVPQMLREVQKVSAALHLPGDEGHEKTVASAAATTEGGTAEGRSTLRPFTTGRDLAGWLLHFRCCCCWCC